VLRRSPGRPCSFRGGARAGAADAIDGTVVVIGDEANEPSFIARMSRTVHVVVCSNEAGHERFHRRNVHRRSNLMVTTSPPIFTLRFQDPCRRKEDHVAIFIGQARCRCRTSSPARRVGPEQCDRLGELAAGAPPAEFGVGEVALVAIGDSRSCLAGLGDAIELGPPARPPTANRRAFSGKVELLQRRIASPFHDLADTVGVDLEALPIRVRPIDLGVPLRWQADFAGRADLEVELLVRGRR